MQGPGRLSSRTCVRLTCHENANSDSGNYSARLPRLLSRAICINIREAAKPPIPNPTTRNRQTVPSFVSIQYPATPGRTITNETAIIRQAHSYAFASTERSSGGFVTNSACKYAALKPEWTPTATPKITPITLEADAFYSENSPESPAQEQHFISDYCVLSTAYVEIVLFFTKFYAD